MGCQLVVSAGKPHQGKYCPIDVPLQGKHPSIHMPRPEIMDDMFQNTMPQRAGYPKILETVCLEPHWLWHTSLLRYLKVFQCIFRESPGLQNHCQSGDFVSSVLEQILFKAYGQRRARCLLTGSDVFSTLANFARSPHDGSSANVGLALLIILQHDKADTIIAKFGELCDRVARCGSAQKQGYNLIVRHAAQVLEFSAIGCDNDDGSREYLSTYESATRRFNSCVEDFLDDFKEHAWKSAILEPARFYFDAIGDVPGRDHVVVHGLNAYLCLLRGGLNVQLPLIPLENDSWYDNPQWWGPGGVGLASPWEALTKDAWVQFSASENFGLAFEGIRTLCKDKQIFVKRRAGCGSLNGTPRSLERRARKGDSSLEIYMSHFAHFFRRDFLVRRMLENLNAESKLEHAGFCKARDVLYEAYRHEVGANEETFTAHVYDEYFINLDIDRTCKFFQWLGILKPIIKPLPAENYTQQNLLSSGTLLSRFLPQK